MITPTNDLFEIARVLPYYQEQFRQSTQGGNPDSLPPILRCFLRHLLGDHTPENEWNDVLIEALTLSLSYCLQPQRTLRFLADNEEARRELLYSHLLTKIPVYSYLPELLGKWLTLKSESELIAARIAKIDFEITSRMSLEEFIESLQPTFALLAAGGQASISGEALRLHFEDRGLMNTLGLHLNPNRRYTPLQVGEAMSERALDLRAFPQIKNVPQRENALQSKNSLEDELRSAGLPIYPRSR